MTRGWAPIRWVPGAVVLGALMIASAAALSVTSNPLAAGQKAIPACDADGVTLVPVLTSSKVSSVDISGIANTCATGTLKVTVANSTTSTAGTATIPSGGTVSVSISPNVTLENATSISLVFSQVTP